MPCRCHAGAINIIMVLEASMRNLYPSVLALPLYLCRRLLACRYLLHLMPTGFAITVIDRVSDLRSDASMSRDSNGRLTCIQGHVSSRPLHSWAFVLGALIHPCVAQSERFVADIVADARHPSRARVDFGARKADELLDVEVVLRNTADQQIRYDSVVVSCACTELSPKQMTLPKGGAESIQLKIRTQSNPRSSVGGGYILFNLGQQPQFSLDFHYVLSDYAGLGSQFVKVDVVDTDNPRVKVVIPLVTGPNVLPSDIEFELDDIEGKLEAAIVDLENQLFTADIVLDSPLNETAYGQLRMLDLRGGSPAIVRIAITPKTSVQFFPNVLRLRKSEEGMYTATAYLRHDWDDSDEKPHVGEVWANVGDIKLVVSRTAINDKLDRIVLKVPSNREVDLHDHLKDVSRDFRTPQGTVSVSFGSENVEFFPLIRMEN